MKRKHLLGVVLLAVLAAIVALAAWLFWPPPGRPDEAGTSGTAGTPSASGTPSAVPTTGERPGKWAQPVELPGCPNLHKVSDDLYRGAQPTAEGMCQLKTLGIKTIVNLRSFHSDRDEMKEAGVELNYEHITMKAWHAEDKEIVRFIRIMSRKDNLPVFVHCQHGADRTGTMCVTYRVALQGWSKEDAVREMRDGGFGFHEVWQNLLRYIDGLDFEDMKRRAAEEG